MRGRCATNLVCDVVEQVVHVAEMGGGEHGVEHLALAAVLLAFRGEETGPEEDHEVTTNSAYRLERAPWNCEVVIKTYSEGSVRFG